MRTLRVANCQPADSGKDEVGMIPLMNANPATTAQQYTQLRGKRESHPRLGAHQQEFLPLAGEHMLLHEYTSESPFALQFPGLDYREFFCRAKNKVMRESYLKKWAVCAWYGKMERSMIHIRHDYCMSKADRWEARPPTGWIF